MDIIFDLRKEEGVPIVPHYDAPMVSPFYSLSMGSMKVGVNLKLPSKIEEDLRLVMINKEGKPFPLKNLEEICKNLRSYINLSPEKRSRFDCWLLCTYLLFQKEIDFKEVSFEYTDDFKPGDIVGLGHIRRKKWFGFGERPRPYISHSVLCIGKDLFLSQIADGHDPLVSPLQPVREIYSQTRDVFKIVV